MIVYRLSKLKYARDLTGKGSEKAGGRWNSKGIALVYTAETRALCTAEIAVHTPLGNLPTDYMLVSIEIPDTIKIKQLSSKSLPRDWKSFPHSHTTQEVGDQFIQDSLFAVLKVPSAVVQGEFNYLLNPNHPDFSQIKITGIEHFDFDERLFIK
jgi:RES domain-containing protein